MTGDEPSRPTATEFLGALRALRDEFSVETDGRRAYIPIVGPCVKFVREGATHPVFQTEPLGRGGLGLREKPTSCMASTILASLRGNEVLRLDKSNIGCPAAAIANGLIVEPAALIEDGCYPTESREVAVQDVNDGLLYAPSRETGRSDLRILGEGDPGRFKDLATARHALGRMTHLEGRMDALYYWSIHREIADVVPDFVQLYLPSPFIRHLIAEAYYWQTGEEILAVVRGLRGVSDVMTARLIREIEERGGDDGRIAIGSDACLGARAVGGIGINTVGLAVSTRALVRIVDAFGKHGYPLELQAHMPLQRLQRLLQAQQAAERAAGTSIRV